VEGAQALGQSLEVAELRVHDASPLAGTSLAEARVRTETDANIVGQWVDYDLHSPPAARERLEPGSILIAVGSPESIQRLRSMARPLTQERSPVVVGQGDVGRELVQILRDAGEDVFVIDEAEGRGVDLVGSVVDHDVLERSPIATARVVILTLESDSAAAFAAAGVRTYAPDVPIIASVATVENIGHIQRAGADFTISMSQVAGQLLARHVLGETVSLQPRIKLIKTAPGRLAGRNLLTARIRERTGCTIVAVERDGQVLMDFPGDFTLSASDGLYLCGTRNALKRYDEAYPASRL
jgi:Trk K+ transport system NAD-binding subunit